MSSRATAILITLLCAAACKVGPDYSAPHTEMPRTFAEESKPSSPESGDAPRADDKEVDLREWWRSFGDPELDALIDRAVRGNRDLILAASRVRMARAQEGVVAGALYPEIAASAGYNRARGSSNVELPLGAASTSSAPTPPFAPADVGGGANTRSSPPLTPLGQGGLPGATTNLYQVGFDASWELDVFGGTARAIEAAEAGVGAAVEDERSVLVTLLAETASTYIELRSAQKRLSIARENLGAQRALLEIAQDKFDAGFVTDLDVSRQLAQVASTEATIPSLEASERETMHALAFLLGLEPTALAKELEEPVDLPQLPPRIPLGIPSDLLRRRPDVRRAERQLASATAEIGVATADLFPKFNLIGSAGLDATDPAKLFEWSSRYYSISPTISWPVFAGGRIRANIQVRTEMQQQALTSYDTAVARALQDVEDALVHYGREGVRRTHLDEAARASGRALELAREQFANGVVDQLSILDAQRTALSAQDSLAQSDAALRKHLIALYKALGGGWSDFDEPPPSERAKP
jgi:NodT family efflux transporter outer membrane factor (OMF) lipoprotein